LLLGSRGGRAGARLLLEVGFQRRRRHDLQDALLSERIDGHEISDNEKSLRKC
jgi:hypothetical protein